MERLLFLVFCAIVLFATALFGAWLPMYFSRSNRDFSAAYHIGNTLSGGVMLSAGFCHLLADSLRHIAFVGRFPLATFLAALGLLVTMAADQLVHIIRERQEASASRGSLEALEEGVGGEGQGEDRPLLSRDPQVEMMTAAPGSGVALLQNSATAPSAHRAGGAGDGGLFTLDQDEEEMGDQGWRSNPQLALASLGDGLPGVASSGSGSAAGKAARALLHPLPSQPDGAYHKLPGPPRPPVSITAAASQIGGGRAHGHANGHSHGHAQRLREGSVGGGVGRQAISLGGAPGGDCTSATVLLMDGQAGGGRKLNFATAVILAAALCVHSVLEGMALGAQPSMRSTQDIMIAIAAHKGLAAYALGSSVVQSKASPYRFWVVISAFSLATPLAIFLGYALSAVAEQAGGAALSALASGTFLYVAMMEVIPRELADPAYRAPKLFALGLGFGLMSLLAVWA